VETRPDGRAGIVRQLWVWNLAPSDVTLPDPASLLLQVDLKEVDNKGRIRIDYGGGEVTELPASADRLHLEREQGAGVRIDGPAAMQALWRTRHWRLTILDRKGRIRVAAESASPPRAQIEASFARLARQLLAAAASPAQSRSCWELDDGATI
jgi:hypothetical protein